MSFENLQVEINQLPKVEDISYTPLERGFLFITLIQNSIFFLALAGILVFVVPEIEHEVLRYVKYFALGLVGLYLLRTIVLIFAYRYKAYALRERDIIYRSGLLFRSLTLVPFKRVQHCEVTQGPLSRLFGLSRLKIFTAGGNQSDISIPGLPIERANQLRNFILNKLEIGEEE